MKKCLNVNLKNCSHNIKCDTYQVVKTSKFYLAYLLKSGNIFILKCQHFTIGQLFKLMTKKKNQEFSCDSRLRIWHFHCSSSGCCSGVGSVPGSGTCICHGCRNRKKIRCSRINVGNVLWVFFLFFFFCKIPLGGCKLKFLKTAILKNPLKQFLFISETWTNPACVSCSCPYV